MEYEKIDEEARYLKACENVKKIVNAIKNIKMKYYTNFAKISSEDKEVYEQLNKNLEKISQENDLENLKVVLMQEVSDKYDNKELKKESRNPNSIDNRLLACYGSIDVQQKALSVGKIGQARKCQKILEEYLDEIGSDTYREIVKKYKREKFAELVMERVAIQEKNDAYMGLVERCFELKNAKERETMKSKIAQEEKKKEILFTNDVEIAKEVSMEL